ncbi:class D sortase [Bacillus sp. BHET2]|uniref:class D sortase n=1 Tax=Bacillus sp. BHET2 TaxID=2583818 RepID=UPI00110E8688|nr:class D sortase [Bacillus sp. BHET2]TMU84054.1 class D sortase [Bacillus sp. BHET2]
MKFNALKIVSIFLLVSGSTLLIYSAYQLISHNKKENIALAEAQSLVKESTDKSHLESPSFKYSFHTGDIIGILEIPKLNKQLPVIEGTDESELEKGVGHYSTTKLPGQKDRIFLAGHRDTVFKKMGDLQIGDIILFQIDRTTHKYEIFETLIIDETDLSILIPTNPEEILTLSTCYPFEYLSSTEERYIINAKRIE